MVHARSCAISQLWHLWLHAGEVGVEELMEAYALIDMPMTRAQAQAMMDDVDADGSGQMEFEEFKCVASCFLLLQNVDTCSLAKLQRDVAA